LLGALQKKAKVTIDPDSGANEIMEYVFQQKQVLLILDNAEDIPTTRALLPESSTCAVIITTRNRGILPNLNIPRQAEIELEKFSLQETKDFLGTMIGPQTVQKEDAVVDALYRLIGGLPLAARIAGSLLRVEALSIAEYTMILQDEQERLSHLINPNDPDHLNVRASFAISMKFLNKRQARLFACLGACAQEGITSELAQEISELDSNAVKWDLSRLYELSLVNKENSGGNYILHPLLYVFARELAEQQNLLEDAETRYMTYFNIQYIIKHKGNFDVLEENLNNLKQAGQLLIKRKRPAYEFFFKLAPFLYQKGHWSEAIQLIDGFLPIAQAHNDTYTQAHLLLQKGKFSLWALKLDEAEQSLLEGKRIALLIEDTRARVSTQVKLFNLLAKTFQEQSRLEEAAHMSQESERLRRQIGEEKDISKDINARGAIYQRQGKWEPALETYQQSYELRSLEDVHGRASDLFLIGCMHLHLHRLDEALDAFMRSLDLSKSIGDKSGDAGTYNKIGRVYMDQSKFSDAEKYFTLSYKHYGEAGDFHEQAVPLQSLAKLYHKQGKRIYADETFREALAREEEYKSPKGQAMVLLEWGNALIDYEDYHSAFEKLDASFIIEEKLKNERGIKMVLSSLIRVCRRLNRTDDARSYCRRALAVAPHNQEILNMQSKLDK
jgi:tetratricopeptide (TPR) repeat protein